MSDTRPVLLRIAGICAAAAPILVLGGDALLSNSNDTAGQGGSTAFLWTIVLWAGFVLFLPAVVGMTYMLASAGSRLAYLGGCLAFFGAAAGASMQVLFRVYAVLGELGNTAASEQLRSTFKLVAATQMIGLTWPLGLLMLAIAALATRRFHIIVPVCLVIAAISFPIGRIAFIHPAVIISGLALAGAFVPAGLKMISSARLPAE